MPTRQAVVLTALLFGALVLGSTWAQEPAARRKNRARPNAAAVERRLADLEAGIDKLMKEVQALRKERNAPSAGLEPGEKTEFKVFALKHAKADSMAKLLGNLFPAKDGLTLRIAGEPTSNALLIRGSREEAAIVEAIIDRLDVLAAERSSK